MGPVWPHRRNLIAIARSYRFSSRPGLSSFSTSIAIPMMDRLSAW